MLQIENLVHTYPNGVEALKGIDLKVDTGMFGLLGPNGAGKSSLMRTIATLQQPTGGQIWFGDMDVLKSPDELRRVLGYLPQDFGVYPRGSAVQWLDHRASLKGLTDRKTRKQAVENLINQSLLLQEAGRQGTQPEQKLVDDRFNETVKRFPSPEEFQTALNSMGLSKEAFQAEIKEDLMIEALLDEQSE